MGYVKYFSSGGYAFSQEEGGLVGQVSL